MTVKFKILLGMFLEGFFFSQILTHVIIIIIIFLFIIIVIIIGLFLFCFLSVLVLKGYALVSWFIFFIL